MYFKFDINNVKQRRNNIVIFNAEFHNFDQRQNNVAKINNSKKTKKRKVRIKKMEYTELKISTTIS